MRWLIACPVGEGRTKNGVDLGRALAALGEEVAWHDVDARPAAAAMVPKPLRGAAWKRWIAARLSEALHGRLRAAPPDVLLVVKGLAIDLAVIAAARQAGILTVCMWIDDPVDHERSVARAGAFDIYLTNDRAALPDYHARGHRHVGHFPGSADPALFHPRPELARDVDVSFVGTRTDRREQALRALAMPAARIHGSGWDGVGPGAGRIGGKLLTGAFNAIINRSRVNLNVHTWFGDGAGMNLRLFEVPAAGGFLLTDWVAEIDEAYEEDRHLACWRSFDELRDKARFYLAHEAARERIAAAGRAHFLARHAYPERARQLLGLVRHRTIAA